jgi:hypothetical protein
VSEELDKPATRRDLYEAITELKVWILKREMWIAFAFLGIQITYFFGTLASLWFMLAHYKS